MRMLGLSLLVMMVMLSACASASDVKAAAVDTAAMKELADWWAAYKTAFIESSGRVLRPLDYRDTVSEGQSYGMLFAVMLNDRETFDKIHLWTRENLSRTKLKADRLFGWHWEKGSVTDWNSAADADLDYAMALILAHRRWGDEAFLDEARLVGADILTHETRRPDGMLLLVPGVWADMQQEGVMLNPSYFSPATYRLLEEATGDARWKELTESAYSVWTRVSKSLGKRKGVGLVPDWCRYTPEGEIRSINTMAWTYGWEALRFPVRAGMDVLLWKMEEPRRLMKEGPCRHFRDWFGQGKHYPAAVYDYDGRMWDDKVSLAMTSTALFAFQVAGEDPPEELVKCFEAQRKDDFFANDYYAQSMPFFPLAFRAGLLGPELLKKRQ